VGILERRLGLELRSTVLAEDCIVRVLSSASRARIADNRHPWYGENFACSLVEVELVAFVATEPGNVVALEIPFSLGRTGHCTPTSRTIEEELLPSRANLPDSDI
jgi:hypothetical protein